MAETKPQLRFSKTENGYFCEYLSNDWSLTGVGAFGITPEAAEATMWQVLNKIKKAQMSVHPIVFNLTPWKKPE